MGFVAHVLCYVHNRLEGKTPAQSDNISDLKGLLMVCIQRMAVILRPHQELWGAEYRRSVNGNNNYMINRVCTIAGNICTQVTK